MVYLSSLAQETFGLFRSRTSLEVLAEDCVEGVAALEVWQEPSVVLRPHSAVN